MLGPRGSTRKRAGQLLQGDQPKNWRGDRPKKRRAPTTGTALHFLSLTGLSRPSVSGPSRCRRVAGVVRCATSTGTSACCFSLVFLLCRLVLSAVASVLVFPTCSALATPTVLLGLHGFLVVAISKRPFAGGDVCRFFGLKRRKTAADRSGCSFSPVLCWPCPARPTVVSVLAGLQRRYEWCTLCFVSPVMLRQFDCLTPLGSQAACGQSAYSQQVPHVLYTFTRGVVETFVSSGFHKILALPWVLFWCLAVLHGRPHLAQAFATRSSLSKTSTGGTDGVPRLCAVEVDAETEETLTRGRFAFGSQLLASAVTRRATRVFTSKVKEAFKRLLLFPPPLCNPRSVTSWASEG